MTKLKIDKTKQNQTVTKLEKSKLWQNSRTQTLTKLKKQIVTKLVRSNCNQTQKTKIVQN